MLPKVTFLCPTFGRFPTEGHLLDEKVYWFSVQDYAGPKELLILNDAKDQTLLCDVPGVRVVNVPARFHSLGEKMNAMIAMADGDVLLPDEDDDVSLPNRAHQASAMCGPGSFKFFDVGARWYQEGVGGKVVYDAKNCTHHASCYRRDAGVYYLPLRGSQDQAVSAMMERRAKADDGVWYRRQLPKPQTLSYVYRWGYSRSHLSGHPDMSKAWDNWPAPHPGTFVIRPRMWEDYRVLVGQAITDANETDKGV